LNPASLDKSETDTASKKVFEYSLKISENYYAAEEFDQALNFSQIVNHADPANLGAALLISQVYIKKENESEALKVLTNSLNKYGRRTDQTENQKKALELQTSLNQKLNPPQQKAPEQVPIQKEEPKKEEPKKEEPKRDESKREEPKKSDASESKPDLSYTLGYGLTGGSIGLAVSYAFKLDSSKKILVTGISALTLALFAYFKGGDDQKKEK
jgi:hypothetical protein